MFNRNDEKFPTDVEKNDSKYKPGKQKRRRSKKIEAQKPVIKDQMNKSSQIVNRNFDDTENEPPLKLYG